MLHLPTIVCFDDSSGNKAKAHMCGMWQGCAPVSGRGHQVFPVAASSVAVLITRSDMGDTRRARQTGASRVLGL